MTTHLRSLRFALVAAGLAVAAPSFASVSPLCGGEKDEKHDDKTKTDNNKKTEKEPKKPTNPA